MILLQSMMDQINQLKLKNWAETWEVLLFQAQKIPCLLNLNQMVVFQKMDFLQQSNIIHIMISLVYIMEVVMNQKWLQS